MTPKEKAKKLIATHKITINSMLTQAGSEEEVAELAIRAAIITAKETIDNVCGANTNGHQYWQDVCEAIAWYGEEEE